MAACVGPRCGCHQSNALLYFSMGCLTSSCHQAQPVCCQRSPQHSRVHQEGLCNALGVVAHPVHTRNLLHQRTVRNGHIPARTHNKYMNGHHLPGNKAGVYCWAYCKCPACSGYGQDTCADTLHTLCAGLDTLRTDCAGLDTLRTDCAGLITLRTDCAGLDTLRTKCAGLNTLRTDCAGLDTLRTNCAGLG